MNNPLRERSEQYSLLKLVIKFAEKTDSCRGRAQSTVFSRDFDTERRNFLPGLDVASRKTAWQFLSSEPLGNEPDLYDLLRLCRPHYNALENQLTFWLRPKEQQAIKEAVSHYEELLTEAQRLVKLDAIGFRVLDPEKNSRQIKLLNHSLKDSGYATLNGYRRIVIDYGQALRDGTIKCIEVFDNLEYSPDNYLECFDTQTLASFAPSKTSSIPNGAKVIENPFRKAQ